jgi:hypothetical protein
VVVPSCGDGGGGWTEEDEASFGGGSGGGHTVDLVRVTPPQVPLPQIWVLGSPWVSHTPTWIRMVYLGADLSGESSTRKISMGSSSSSSSSMVFPFPSLPLSRWGLPRLLLHRRHSLSLPSLCLNDENLKCLDATG